MLLDVIAKSEIAWVTRRVTLESLFMCNSENRQEGIDFLRIELFMKSSEIAKMRQGWVAVCVPITAVVIDINEYGCRGYNHLYFWALLDS